MNLQASYVATSKGKLINVSDVNQNPLRADLINANFPYLQSRSADVSYTRDTASLAQTQLGKFSGLSLLYSYRPYFQSPDDYATGYDVNQVNSLIIYNNSTSQTVSVGLKSPLFDTLIAATVSKSHYPAMVTVCGAVPFFADINDTIDVVFLCANPDGGASSQVLGKVLLQFAEFDVAPFNQVVLGGTNIEA